MSRSRRIFFLAWALVALITRANPTDDHEWSRLGTVESLVERHEYALEGSKFRGTGDKILYQGHFYSHQPPILATIEAPVYWFLHLTGLQFWNSAPFDLAYYLFTLLTNGLAFAFTVVIFYELFVLVDVWPPVRAVYAFLLPAGTWLLPYGLVTNNHGIAGALLALVIYLLLEMRFRGPDVWKCGWLGAGLGLLVVIEVTPLVSFVPLTIVYVLARREFQSRARLAAFTAGILVPLLAHSLINVWQTGDIVPGGFHSELFNYPGTKFTASTLTGQWNHHSVADFLDYAWRALFVEKAYFTVAPLLLAGPLVSILCWRWWERARGIQLLLLGGTTASLLVSLLMTNNFGGVAVGFRHATYLVPAFLAMLLPVLSGGRQVVTAWVVNLVAAASTALFLVYAVPHPFWPLVFPAPPPPASIQSYVPIVAQIVGRVTRQVDEFGRPLASR